MKNIIYNVSNKSAQEARYHDAANDMCYLILLWPAHTQQSALAHHHVVIF